VASAGAMLVLGLALCLTACAVPYGEDGGGYGYGDDTYVARVPRTHRRDSDPVPCHSCGRNEHRDHREHHREPDHGAQRAHVRPPEPPRHHAPEKSHAPEKRHESHQGGGHHKSEKSEKKKN